MKFIVTVDTEADNQWKANAQPTLANLKSLPRFQELCERYQVLPTYLVTHEVAEDRESSIHMRAWQDAGLAEIGAHLHPWTTPPYLIDEKHDRITHRFPSDLTDEELLAKLTTLTQKIGERFGRLPKSYRAGRWGFDIRQVAILQRLGYTVDSSITPKINWSSTKGDPQKNGGPDFRKAPIQPYYLPFDGDLYHAGQSRILEVPMTILFTGNVRREGSRLAQNYLEMKDGRWQRMVNRSVFRMKWLRIFAHTRPKHFDAIYDAGQRNRLPCLQFMIHSSELMVGGSPYSKTQSAVDHIFAMMECLFRRYRELNLEPVTLSQFAKKFPAMS